MKTRKDRRCPTVHARRQGRQPLRIQGLEEGVEQRFQLARRSLRALDAKRLVTLASRVDSETAEILACPGDGDSKKRKPIATRAKCEREWESVWDRWQEVTAELGEEDGKYVDQEHHWEAPYFAGDAFAESLDEVAKDILPLIDRVPWLWMEEKNLFRDALLEIKEGVDSYPEWMGEGECALGPVTTTCFLKWEWCARSTKENGTQEFLERLRGTEDELKAIDFDDGAFVEFFTSLPESVKKEILDAMRKIGTAAHWQDRFSILALEMAPNLECVSCPIRHRKLSRRLHGPTGSRMVLWFAVDRASHEET